MSERALYLDTSALVKFIADERESRALGAATVGRQVTSSELALVELSRAAHRLGARHDDVASRATIFAKLERLLGRLVLVPLNRAQLVVAASFPEAHLRSLDAIHLAAALTVGEEVDAVVTYDRRLSRIARRQDLQVLAPA